MKIICSIACTAVGAAAALGLAAPATADPTPGQYNATMIGGNNNKQTGQTIQWSIVECGPDCVHVNTVSGPGVDLRRAGPVWNGVDAEGCNWSVDNASLYLNVNCPSGSTYVIGLARI